MKVRHFNRWLMIILILALTIPQIYIGEIQQVSAAWTATVTSKTLNVREEPSTTAPKVALNGTYVYLVKDQTVNILSEEGDFYYVTLKFNGKSVKGYIHKDYVTVSGKPTPTATPTPKPTATPKPTSKPASTPKPDTTKSVPVVKEIELKGTIAASSLNIRSGPDTAYAKVGGLIKGDKVTIISEVMIGEAEWYGISVKSAGKTITGYVLSTYVNLSFDSTIKGEVDVTKLKVRSAAGTKAAYLKNSSGNIITLKENKSVTIIGETTVSGVKWLKVSFTVSDKKYTGYVEASQVNFKVTVKATPTPTTKPTPTAKPKPTVTPKPTNTPVPTPNPSGTQNPTPSPTVTPTPTPTIGPTPTPDPLLQQEFLQVMNNPTLTSISKPVNGYVCNSVLVNLVKDYNTGEFLYDNYNNILFLRNKEQVLVTAVERSFTDVWYLVSLENGIYGYVKAEYIYISGSPSGSTGATPIPTPVITDNMDFESKLTQQGFPESYKAGLRQLHAQYPNWEFRAYHTGLDWNTVIAAESVPGKNVIPNSKGVEWKSLESGAYNWKTDTFIVFDGSTWVTASKAAIEYYMDPRNFLTTNGIFQFELLKYQEAYQNLAGVENILKGTAMYNTSYTYTDDNGKQKTMSYGQTFIEAAKYSGVSPYHLASRVKQEVVTGPTTLSNSVSGTYSGYEGLYNFYNIGANDSAGGGAVANGLKYAKNGSTNSVTNQLYMIPWTSPFRSIVGGSYFIGGSYINRGQDTIYLQKFNVTPISTYYHQYMTNVEAPYAEGKKILTAYNGMADSQIIFSIPVYLNMPSAPCPQPTTMFNPNNRMKSLKILDAKGNELSITPTFNQTEYNYYLIVQNTVDVVQINATTVSKKATISGGGTIPLNVGNNTVVISVIAENGSIANYTINIVRE
jgi:beta-N-acetylglucosaminidase/outer membrane biosynthesis protein TonB